MCVEAGGIGPGVLCSARGHAALLAFPFSVSCGRVRVEAICS